METATLPPRPGFVLQPPPAPTPRRPPRSGWRRRPRSEWRPLRAVGLPRAALGLILIGTLLLRLWGIKQGLPYSYNVDEAQHFVPRAISFFSSDWNPHYFLNPPAYSYVLTGVFELWFGSADAAVRAYATNPTELFVVARVVAALLGTAAVWLTYLTGARLFSRSVGLLAAAILGFAFLPVFYSHLALNDVPALAPVSLSLLGIAGVFRRGWRRDYVIAGLGIGLAAATKYTAGITLLSLLAACVVDSRRRGPAPALLALGIGLLTALAAFTVANPYWILDFKAFATGISDQATRAAGAEPVKLGTRPGGGVAYYLWTFSWGLGLGPSIAALSGAAMMLIRRRFDLLALFLPATVAYIVFMGEQQRYFGRWLLPVFPLAALVAGWAACEAVRWLRRAHRVPVGLGVSLATVLLLGQGVVAVVRNDRILSRPDTRNLLRAWMVGHVPAGQKVVIEPLVPGNWAADVGRSLRWTASGQRWYQYPTWLSTLGADGRPLPDGRRRFVAVDEYERVLRPALVDEYLQSAYCWVVIGSLQAGRAFAQPRDAPQAVAYYRALAGRGSLVYRVSPFSPGAAAVPFGFDWSIDYYPRQYHLPGPAISVYHLRGGRCS
jgi:4-amino-4-deoxy-L-arabinose transferase-like glycosyltransferase